MQSSVAHEICAGRMFRPRPLIFDRCVKFLVAIISARETLVTQLDTFSVLSEPEYFVTKMETVAFILAFLAARASAVMTRVPTRAPSSASPTSAPFDTSCLHATAWFVNQNEAYSTIFDSYLDVTTSGFVNASTSTTGWQATFTGIPFYGHTFTTEEINELNSRPDASTDFPTGQTTAIAGNYYYFGENIGYSTSKCSLGYWPPGPGCPANYSGTYTFPVFPSPETKASEYVKCMHSHLTL